MSTDEDEYAEAVAYFESGPDLAMRVTPLGAWWTAVRDGAPAREIADKRAVASTVQGTRPDVFELLARQLTGSPP